MNFKLTLTILLVTVLSQAQTFKGSFDLIISQENATGTQHTDTISYYFGEEKAAMIIHARGDQPDLRLVFNPADSIITGLFEMNGNKGGYILPMNKKHWPTMPYAAGEMDIVANSQVDITQNHKDISQYSTKEVTCVNEKIDATFLIAEDIDLSLTQVMAYQFVGSGKDGEEIAALADCGIKQLSLYTTLFDKKRKSTLILKIENLSSQIDTTIFNTSGHQLSDMRKQ